MNNIYSLDTNVVIELLHENKTVVSFIENIVQPQDRIAICSIVYYEVMRGFQISKAVRRMRQFQGLYDCMLQLPLDEQAVKQAIHIYDQLHKGNMIEDNDIYIAAIAMVNGCTLVTANTKHFERIDGLKTINWRDE